ncbi:hypothetical protein M427DRAFT_143905 [Gonapodya prolifera JEL478]|uniref:EXPERA domain-containing protein n=1 Tax=Gonapodya prolifera (strain JEL478) TaxID=1344416 RepID=A0A139ANH2_GONPJ|nr:hypothetical protein M427DRAFT_143905 [Gonapodya prolifera JEL478]|eukprot:KXS18073.1 hypothetical protein M427DRAFT_143905 [Gonapodya prolifera JEL478]
MSSNVTASWANLYPGPPEGFVLEPLSAFFPLITYMSIITVGLTAFLARNKPLHDKVMIGYFIISVFIHFNLERYYTHWNHTILDPTNNDLMARVWRHYGISDTRWWGQQPGIPKSQYSCMYGLEWLAAYECGPLVLLTIILAFYDSPWRWAVQSAAVTAQAYGLFITWLPAFYEDLSSVPACFVFGLINNHPLPRVLRLQPRNLHLHIPFSKPPNPRRVSENDPILYWGYFIGMQSPWAFFPVLAVIQSGWETVKIFNRVKELEAIVGKTKKQ